MDPEILVTFAASGEQSLGEIATGAWGFLHIFWWLVAFAASVTALVFAFRFYKDVVAADPGDEDMIRIAGYVSRGAMAYLWQQYKVVGIVFAVIFGLLAILAYGLDAQSGWVPFAFITGGFFSGLAGFFGMKTATAASSRTTAAARNSLNQGLQVAFRSGAVMGLTVVGLGLIDITAWFFVLYFVVPWFVEPLSLEEITVAMLCFGMGASTQALFARVGGGIFTKAADVGADLVGKVEAGIPEDDPRNPATIADNVGDNVGDVAGMGADLYESFCGSILASAALGVAAMASQSVEMGWDVNRTAEMQLYAILLPMALGGIGTLLSIVGIFWVRTEENADQATLLKALARGIDGSSLMVIAAAFLLVFMVLGFSYWGIAMAVVVGLAAGWAIGKWTEYSTSDVYQPTRSIADQAQYGPATVIIAGIAEGMQSTWVPTLLVCVGTVLSYGFATGFEFDDPNYISLGLYGIGVAAVGMLSTLGITLATDAYGPIADNAGGNAEMTHQDPIVRERTDALDSLGNTTAATGKGFAIGSAALTALALLAAYVEEVRFGYVRWARSVSIESIEQAGEEGYPLDGRVFVKMAAPHSPIEALEDEGAPAETEPAGEATLYPTPFMRITDDPKDDVRVQEANMRNFMDLLDVNAMNPRFLVGILLGSMLVFTFSAMTMKAVGRAAGQMVAEVRRQFKEIPGIMDGSATPEYASCVEISTRSAQIEMIPPSMLALISPVLAGLLLGIAGVIGLLIGTLATGFATAVMMANAGGAWDNAKKYIEAGNYGGKGSEAHKAGVVGDTVGDPFKDTSGPSINILIKMMSMVSVVVAGFIVMYNIAG
ncbi:K(+)-insensitive pyrophosphate-energized proton pump [Planctomycetes bacterium Pan216]|uniref:Putative K(+)-stimulated pyrophosphate-energized sodium pump n=1 Tax=Kolteria novifilia TaxID=2527975 RepID=A0A518BB73_9BACT|nr:K(+)-insensitive pyrophosphate-energized proton pump [Planctomycetes bacterium Pan216]